MLIRFTLIFCLMFSSPLFAFDETYIQCHDLFFKISDPEEVGFFGDGDDGVTKLHSLSVSESNPPKLQENLESSASIPEGNKGWKSELFFDVNLPSMNWIDRKNIILTDVFSPFGDTKTRSAFYWKGYIDRAEGEAWWLVQESRCLSGCQGEAIIINDWYENVYPKARFKKALKYSDCSKTSRRDIEKILVMQEKEKREKAREQEREMKEKIKAQRKF